MEETLKNPFFTIQFLENACVKTSIFAFSAVGPLLVNTVVS